MPKLNLVGLTKDELSKEEAQKIKAGLICDCYCTCSCSCPPEDRIVYRIENRIDDRVFIRNEFTA